MGREIYIMKGVTVQREQERAGSGLLAAALVE
jgi:hypothetical protein